MVIELSCPETCPFIRRGEKNPVLPDGNPGGILIIGEAPGFDEVKAGHGFAGKAGDNLIKALNSLGWSWITKVNHKDKLNGTFLINADGKAISIARANACLCHPTKTIRTGNRYGDEKTFNRKPKVAELRSCSQNLKSAIEYYQPTVVLLVGETATRNVLVDVFGYRIIGQYIKYCMDGNFPIEDDVTYISIPHTSSLCWNRSTDGIKHSDIGINNIRKALEYFND